GKIHLIIPKFKQLCRRHNNIRAAKFSKARWLWPELVPSFRPGMPFHPLGEKDIKSARVTGLSGCTAKSKPWPWLRKNRLGRCTGKLRECTKQHAPAR